MYTQTYHAPGFLVVVNVDSFIEGIKIVLLPPEFGILELSESVLRNKFPSTEVPSTKM